MLNFKDFETDGKVDWNAYRKAEIAAGQRCRKCGRFILFGKGEPTKCSNCRDMDESTDEVCSDHSVRCPKCRHQMDISRCELYDLYEEGDHDVSCQECDHDFEVVTVVNHTFKSPALVDSPESEDANG